MPADTFNYDDLADLRYNPFTNKYSPKIIGYGSSSPEERTIPSTSPFIIKLFESPLQTVPLKTKITLKATGEILKEVAKGTTPANKQYAVNYDELGNGQVLFNSGQAGQVVYINYYGLGTLHQRSTLKFQIFGNASTKVVASSDSSTGSQTIADEIILTTEDAGVKINSIITELSTIGGGEIKILEGTYNVSTTITSVASKNIKISGSGFNTIFKKNINLTYIVDIGEYCSCNDINLDGNKSLYTGNGIRSQYNSSFLHNIWCHDNGTNGFASCVNMNNCYSYNNNSDGINSSVIISNCYSYNNGGNGISSSTDITTTWSFNNTSDGFNNSDRISSSRSYGNNYGFRFCEHITASEASTNTINGFHSSNYIAVCESNSNTQDGYDGCFNVTSSYASGNVNGFDGCRSIQSNRSTGNSGSNYNNSFADRSGTDAASDNAVGGYNG